ncbi:hypothetical protein BU15DRAFT_82004 [Melanogaster broomeanus]|nr:hypothetical protein BU15DRAFT_82004 [Melanogaster broomeanus]
MPVRKTPLSDAPPAYRYVHEVLWAKFETCRVCNVPPHGCLGPSMVSSFKDLQLDENDNFPKLTPLAIAQGVMYAVACVFETLRCYCRRVGIGFMRVVTHFTFKSDLIAECEIVAQNGTIASVFGIWGTSPTSNLNQEQAVSYCNDQWNRDSWTEIIVLLIVIVLGLLFTSIAFAYFRQTVDPASPINASRAPSNQIRMDGYPTHYNAPYDTTGYMPAYSPPDGPPPFDGKPPDYKRGSYISYGESKDAKEDAKEDDPFSDYDGPSVPMPTHWAEERDVASSRV